MNTKAQTHRSKITYTEITHDDLKAQNKAITENDEGPTEKYLRDNKKKLK